MTQSPNGDLNAAVDFLTHWQPDGPWCLTSIVPDGPTTTRTFYPRDREAMRDWIAARIGRENVYFAVNRVKRNITKKATKDDVGAVVALHVDCDPEPGVDIAEARAAILAKLEARDPAPSVIIDSGGGYQAFWLLREPEVIRDTTQEELRAGEVARLEAYNRQIEIELGGDHCHNIDRIMRLPGTVNLPNKKKRSKGREPVPATLFRGDWDRRYSLDDFVPAASVEGTAPAGTRDKVVISANLPQVDVDQLPVTADLRETIRNGAEPGGDRSAAVWHVTCELVKAGLSDDEIAAVLLDPDLRISEHVRDQRRSDTYVARQIGRARVRVSDGNGDRLLEMNDRHALIASVNGKTRVLTEGIDPVSGTRRFDLATCSEFAQRYQKESVEVGRDRNGNPTRKNLAKWWMEHPAGRLYQGIIFSPGRDYPGYYNTWRGFGVEARPGSWEKFREHIRTVICAGDDRCFDYLIKWMARVVQRPAEPGQVAVVLRGGKGVGKSLFAETFGRLFDSHFLTVAQKAHLTGNFNYHLSECVLLFAEEAHWSGDRDAESVLKMMITGSRIPIEQKGYDVTEKNNFLHVIFASNSDWAVPASHDERRFFVLDVSPEKRDEAGYFEAIIKEMKDGGLSAMLHDLMRVDLTAFDVRRFPRTNALVDQKLISLTLAEKWWKEKLWSGRIFEGDAKWLEFVPKDDLVADFIEGCRRRGTSARQDSTDLGKLLTRLMGNGWPRSERRMSVLRSDRRRAEDRTPERHWHYRFPPLAEARSYFAQWLGAPDMKWPEDDGTDAAESFTSDDPPF